MTGAEDSPGTQRALSSWRYILRAPSGSGAMGQRPGPPGARGVGKETFSLSEVTLVSRALGHASRARETARTPSPASLLLASPPPFTGPGSRRKCGPGCGLKISRFWPRTVPPWPVPRLLGLQSGTGYAQSTRESILSPGLQGQGPKPAPRAVRVIVPTLFYQASSSQPSKQTDGYSQNNRRTHTFSRTVRCSALTETGRD